MQLGGIIARQLLWFSFDVCQQKLHLFVIFGLAIRGWGGGIRYCEITTIARLHFTPYSGLKQRLLLVICHGTLFLFCLGVRFLFFLIFYCKKAPFLACIFPKLFNCLLFLFCFEALKFQIWHCLLPLTYYVVCLPITYF